jgi:hypothetical protein
MFKLTSKNNLGRVSGVCRMGPKVGRDELESEEGARSQNPGARRVSGYSIIVWPCVPPGSWILDSDSQLLLEMSGS